MADRPRPISQALIASIGPARLAAMLASAPVGIAQPSEWLQMLTADKIIEARQRQSLGLLNLRS